MVISYKDFASFHSFHFVFALLLPLIFMYHAFALLHIGEPSGFWKGCINKFDLIWFG